MIIWYSVYFQEYRVWCDCERRCPGFFEIWIRSFQLLKPLLPGYRSPPWKGAADIEKWISLAKELPTSALICIIVLLILYKIIKEVLGFLVAWKGTDKGYNQVKFGKTKLSRDSVSSDKTNKTEDQPTEVNGKMISFPSGKSNKQNNQGGK